MIVCCGPAPGYPLTDIDKVLADRLRQARFPPFAWYADGRALGDSCLWFGERSTGCPIDRRNVPEYLLSEEHHKNRIIGEQAREHG
jgi:hypothetical protein